MRAEIGDRCALDDECVARALCHQGRCSEKAAVLRQRKRDLEDVVRKAAASVEAIGERVQQGVEALEPASARPDAGESGGGIRSVGTAHPKGKGFEVRREDYQRQSAGER